MTEEPKKNLLDLRRGPEPVIAGVGSGIARFFNIDPVLVRIILVILAIFGGSGIILYFGLWILLPSHDGEKSLLATWFNVDANEPKTRQIGLYVILFAAAVVLISSPENDGFGLVDEGLIWAVFWLAGLAAAGYWFFVNRPRKSVDTGTTTQTPHSDASSLGPDTGVIPATVAKPKKELGDSSLSLATLSLAAIVLGIMGFFDLQGATFDWSTYVAVALGIIGLGLLIATFLGNGSGLIWIGIIGIAILSSQALSQQVGLNDSHNIPRSIGEVQPEYVSTAGDFILDLRNIEPAQLFGREISIEAGVGSVSVILPQGVPVEVEASTSLGEVRIFDRTAGGFGAELEFRDTGIPNHFLSIEIESAIGEIKVAR